MSETPEPRRLLVQGDKTFMLTIPTDAHLTFGPWSPPNTKENGNGYRSNEERRGTLRIYADAGQKHIIGVFSGVTSFRDMSLLGYAEEVERVQSETIWKDDEKGYFRQTQGTRERAWVDRQPKELPF